MAEPVSDGVVAPLPGKCAFYVVKKKRYCKMVVGSGKTFCGEHAIAVCAVNLPLSFCSVCLCPVADLKSELCARVLGRCSSLSHLFASAPFPEFA